MPTDVRFPYAAMASDGRTYVVGPDHRPVCYFEQEGDDARWMAAVAVAAALNLQRFQLDDGK